MDTYQRRQTLKSLLALATAGGALAITKQSVAADTSTTTWQYVVTDTSITDHSNPSITGSIAWALSQANSRGGGTVTLGTGRFRLTSQALVIRKGIRLIGTSKIASIIVQTHPTADAIIVASGTPHVSTHANLEHFGIEMPTQAGAGDAINLAPTQAGHGNIMSISISGGNADSWGISNHGSNVVNYLDIHISGGMNGLRWFTDNVVPDINYGDCYVQGIDIMLSLPDNIGIYMSGREGATINNIHFARIEIAYVTNQYYWSSPNTVGIYLSGYTARNSFVHVDLENLTESLKIDSPNCLQNTFFHLLHIGPSTSFPTLDSSYFVNQTFWGGNKPFLRYAATSLSSEIISLKTNKTLSYTEHAFIKINNTGASKPITLTLPSASNDKSYEFTFFASVPQFITIIAGSGDVIVHPDGTITNKVTSDGAVGRSISIRNMNYKYWIIQSKIGIWK